MKKVVRREFLRIAAAAALVCAAASLTGCGQNVDKLDIDKDSMTCRQIYDGREDEETITYWHKAEDAVKH